MANISGLVDLFVHPEIPYFDREHLIVGGVSAVVSAALLVGLALAEKRIRRLESLSAICMYCKKVRLPSAPTERKESWQSIEAFILRRFDVRFSHGMCPECVEQEFPSADAD